MIDSVDIAVASVDSDSSECKAELLSWAVNDDWLAGAGSREGGVSAGGGVSGGGVWWQWVLRHGTGQWGHAKNICGRNNVCVGECTVNTTILGLGLGLLLILLFCSRYFEVISSFICLWQIFNTYTHTHTNTFTHSPAGIMRDRALVEDDLGMLGPGLGELSWLIMSEDGLQAVSGLFTPSAREISWSRCSEKLPDPTQKKDFWSLNDYSSGFS